MLTLFVFVWVVHDQHTGSAGSKKERNTIVADCTLYQNENKVPDDPGFQVMADEGIVINV